MKALGGEPDGDASDGGSDGESSDTSSGGKSDVSLPPVVDEATFLDAMGSESKAAHKKSLMSEPSSSSTLQTPKCAKPNFWGFPLVETPPKTSVLWFRHGMFFRLGWGFFHVHCVHFGVQQPSPIFLSICDLCFCPGIPEQEEGKEGCKGEWQVQSVEQKGIGQQEG